MPQVQRSTLQRKGAAMTRTEIKQHNRQGLARDDLRTAYGGDENKGPAKQPKSAKQAGTKVKGRETAKSKSRTPVV